MIIKTKSVRHLAKDASIPDEMIDRHLDELSNFVFRVAMRERRFCRDRIRAWYFNNDVGKCELFQVLDDDTDYDLI